MLEITNDYSDSNAKLVVIGVGGAGNNVVNRMVEDNVSNVKFVAVNTDKQQLNMSKAETCIQIGEKLTRGLGCGANPEVGEKSAEESREELTEVIRGADMVFVTCGMGGGTGTGAAPIIAQISKEMGILTVGVVTKPFADEGPVRLQNALSGIEKLRHNVDSIVIIPNDLVRKNNKRIRSREVLRKSDEVLKNAVQGLTDLMNQVGTINLDFADVTRVMKDKGVAHIGVGVGTGENMCMDALNNALNNPYLETSINGAKDILINFSGEIYDDEVGEATAKVREMADQNANIIWGVFDDESVTNQVMVTIVATGIEENSVSAFKPDQFGAFIGKGNMAPRPQAPQPAAGPAFKGIGSGIPDFMKGSFKSAQQYQSAPAQKAQPVHPVQTQASRPQTQAAQPARPQSGLSQPLRPQTNVSQDYAAPSNAEKNEHGGINIPEFLKKNNK